MGIESIKNGKQWSDEDKIKLYKLVRGRGKRWTEFSNIFGVSPSSCKSRYNKVSNWEEIFKRNNLTKDEVDIQAIQENKDVAGDVDEAIETMLEKAKGDIIKKANKRIEKELVDKVAQTDLMFDKLMSSITKVPRINTEKINYPKTSQNKSKEEANLVLSDLHIGLACIPEEVGGMGGYNYDVFKYRLDNLVKTITKITEIHRNSYPVDTLNIMALGDLVHGSNDAGKWGYLHTEQNVMDQIFNAIDCITEMILTLKKVYPNINFYGIYGNHGRVAKRGIEKSFVNWDYLCYKFIQSRLADQKGITFEIPKAPFKVVDVMGVKFLLTHGDQIRSWNGLPFYGLVRAENRYNNMVSRNNSVEDFMEKAKNKDIETSDELLQELLNYAKPPDYFVCGHFHQSAEFESSSGGQIILNNSFVGGDDYTINSLMLSGKASQKFFGVHKEGKSWSYDIDLDRE